MPSRSSELEFFLQCFEASVSSSENAPPQALASARRVFEALATRAGESSHASSAKLPVCAHLDGALENTRKGPAIAWELAVAFSALEPALQWGRRAGSQPQDASFFEGHANSLIVGPRGIEVRNDVWVGVSLLAPYVTYPDHQHPPEEVYTALSDSEWRQGSGEWFTPGLGGIIYNPPGIIHAMRSKANPLLAVWCLWVG